MNKLLIKAVQFLAVVLISFFILIFVQIAGTHLIASGILSNSTDWGVLGNAADWGAAMATIVGFFFLWKQLDREREIIEIQTSAQVYDSGITTLNIFIENRELRSYFYDCKPLPEHSEGDHTWNLVMAACEIMCDQWENTFISQASLNDGVSDIWIRYMKGVYLTSPSLRYFLIQEGYRYDESFVNLFNKELHILSTKTRLRIEAFARNHSTSDTITSDFVNYRHNATLSAIANLNSAHSPE